jgi:WD40 repeat protein
MSAMPLCVCSHDNSCLWFESAAPQGHEEIVWAVEVYGARLFSASADKTIRVWDIDSRRCEHVLEDHTRPVLSLAISGNRLYSGSYDFTIKVRARTCSSARSRGSYGSRGLQQDSKGGAACLWQQ